MVQIGKWEEEHERSFLINGCHYLNIINNQWAAFNTQKEQEKLERVSHKHFSKTHRFTMPQRAINSSILGLSKSMHLLCMRIGCTQPGI